MTSPIVGPDGRPLGIALPKGEIRIVYDYNIGLIDVKGGTLDHATLIQTLAAAIGGTAAQWHQLSAGIVGQNGAKQDGIEKETRNNANDDNND